MCSLLAFKGNFGGSNVLTGFQFFIDNASALQFLNDHGHEVFFEGDEWWTGWLWHVSGPVNNSYFWIAQIIDNASSFGEITVLFCSFK